MGGRGPGGGRRRMPGIKIEENGGKTHFIDRTVIESMKEATGATEEDIHYQLKECSGDVDEATSRLIDSPFTIVTSRRQKRRQRQEDTKRRTEPPQGVGSNNVGGHHGSKVNSSSRSGNGNLGGGYHGKSKPRENQRAPRDGRQGGSRAGANGLNSGAGRRTPYQLGGGKWDGARDDQKPDCATPDGGGAPSSHDKSIASFDQNEPQSTRTAAEHVAPQRTTLADIVRGATSNPPACIVGTDVSHVPVKTGYAAAAARALAAGPQDVDARNKREPPFPNSGVLATPVLSDAAPTEPSELKQNAETTGGSSAFKPMLQEPVVSAGCETVNSAAETHLLSTGQVTGEPQPESAPSDLSSAWGFNGINAQPKDAIDAGARLDYDVSVPVMGHSGGVETDETFDLEPSGNPQYLDPVASVPSVTDDGEDLIFGPTLRFGTFAGIDFGTSITLPGESSMTPETVISLDVVKEADDKDECGLGEAMNSILEHTLIQSSPSVEPPIDNSAVLESSSVVELQDHEHQREDRCVPASSDISLHDAEPAPIMDTCPTSTKQDHPPVAQEVCRDMGTFVQVAAKDKVTDNKADVATQVADEPESQPGKAEPTYTSKGVQHAGYAMSTAASVSPEIQGQEFKVDKGFNTVETQFGDGEVSDSSAQTSQPAHSQYGVTDFKNAESYEPRTDPVPTVPPYHDLPPQIQPPQQQEHDHPAPPPPNSAMSSNQAHSAQPRYGQPSTSAQTDNAALAGTVVPSSIPHPPPVCGAPAVPIVRPMTHITQMPYGNPPGMIPNPAAMPYATHPYYPQYMQYPAQFHGMYGGGYGPYTGGGFAHGAESAAYPAVPPSGGPPKYVSPPYNPGVGGSSVNQGYQASFPGTGVYTLGNSGYDMTNTTGGYGNKDKDNAYLPQGLQHNYPGVGGNQLGRSEMYHYGVPSQAFSQGFRNQHYAQHGYNGQYGAGYAIHPHSYHSAGVQGQGNYRLH